MNSLLQQYKVAISNYCHYRERCHSEVRYKLLELGARGAEVEELITQLIEENLLDEERYARSFARGHFRLKQWGRLKIKAHLLQKQISTYCIAKALSEIEENDYLQTLNILLVRKANELKASRLTNSQKGKLYRYLTQKGFEPQLVNEQIVKLNNKDKGKG